MISAFQHLSLSFSGPEIEDQQTVGDGQWSAVDVQFGKVGAFAFSGQLLAQLEHALKRGLCAAKHWPDFQSDRRRNNGQLFLLCCSSDALAEIDIKIQSQRRSFFLQADEPAAELGFVGK